MLELVIDQRRRSIGGFEVGRVLPYARRRMVGPFVYFDHMGPLELPSGVGRSADVLPHPHIGLSTVTWLFSGELMHRHSVGSEQAIVPGEVNWMVAGRGVTHSERFERARVGGGALHGIQAWVALPEADEEVALLLRTLREQPRLSHEQAYRAFQHIIHHVNIGWNGRSAPEGSDASEEQIAAWSRFPDDITLI